MYFGEFLLDKKIINEEQLLDALIYQVEKMPSFLRVLREGKVISSGEVIRMIQLQLENNSDLISVLKSEKKIDEKKLGELYKVQALKRKMLGSVLVELKFVEQTVIEKMLHEFLRIKDNLKVVAKPVAEVKQAAEVEINQAALDSLRELGFLDDIVSPVSTTTPEGNVFVDEFLNVYSGKMQEKLNKILDIVDQSLNSDSEISNYFNSLYRDILLLKGASSLAGLNSITNILNEYEEVIEEKLGLNEDDLRVWGSSALPKIKDGIAFLWELREIISQDKGEVKIQGDSTLSEKSLQLISVIKNS